MNIKPKDVWIAYSKENEDKLWRFFIPCGIEYKKTKYWIGIKLGTDLDNMQVTIFDKDGKEIDSIGVMNFYLVQKSKKKPSFKVIF